MLTVSFVAVTAAIDVVTIVAGVATATVAVETAVLELSALVKQLRDGRLSQRFLIKFVSTKRAWRIIEIIKFPYVR